MCLDVAFEMTKSEAIALIVTVYIICNLYYCTMHFGN